MTADPFAVYGYESECKRHRDNALRALSAAKENVDALLAQWENGQDAPSADARQLTVNSAEAYAQLQAYAALREVSFLAEDHTENGEEPKP